MMPSGDPMCPHGTGYAANCNRCLHGDPVDVFQYLRNMALYGSPFMNVVYFDPTLTGSTAPLEVDIQPLFPCIICKDPVEEDRKGICQRCSDVMIKPEALYAEGVSAGVYGWTDQDDESFKTWKPPAD